MKFENHEEACNLYHEILQIQNQVAAFELAKGTVCINCFDRQGYGARIELDNVEPERFNEFKSKCISDMKEKIKVLKAKYESL